MTDLAGKSAQEIIAELNRRNRRFKVATVLFMIVAAFALLAIILVGLNNLQQANKQLTQQKELLAQQQQTLDAISDAADQRTSQLAQISKQIDCIAQFFTQRNRTNVVITDLEQCQILNADGSSTQGTGSTTSPQASNGGSTTAPQSQQQPGNQNQQGGNNGNNGNGGGNTEQPEPVRVLGIPVCVPLTRVCVTR